MENTHIRADGYDPATNTVYEYYGDFWHGNPKIYKAMDINNHNNKSFGFLYDKTIEKENMILRSGFKLITVWESDFRKEKI